MDDLALNGSHQPTEREQQTALLQQFTASLGYFILGRNTNINDASPDASAATAAAAATTSTPSKTKSALAIIKEQQQKGLYGPFLQPNALSPPFQTTVSLMDSCLHRDDNDAVGGALISVPALDLQSPDHQHAATATSGGQAAQQARSTGASAVLPSLGKSARVTAATGAGTSCLNPPVIPAMVATVLGNGNNAQSKLFSESHSSSSSSTPPDNNNNNHHPLNNHNSANLLNNATAAATDIEYAAAQNFGRPISYTRSSAPQAPSAMTRVLFDSFSSLIESRIKTWTLRLLRHSLSSGDEDSRVQLMSLLATKNVELSAIVTSFETVGTINSSSSSTTSTAATTTTSDDEKNNNGNGTPNIANQNKATSITGGFSQHNNCDFMIPISMNLHVDLRLHGEIVSLHFYTDGTAAGKEGDDDDGKKKHKNYKNKSYSSLFIGQLIFFLDINFTFFFPITISNISQGDKEINLLCL